MTEPKTPPHDLDAERDILASVLLDRDTWPIVAASVCAADFYHPAHALVFDTMRTLAETQQPIDLRTLVDAVRQTGQLQACGGIEWIASLTDAIPTTAHVEAHCRIVAGFSAARRVISAARDIYTRGMGDMGDAAEFASWSARHMSDLVGAVTSSIRAVSMHEAFAEVWASINASIGGGKPDTMPCKIEALNKLLAGGGFARGRVYTIAGRPGSGKSALAVTLLRDLASAGYRGIFFALEMSVVENVKRMLSAAARVDGMALSDPATLTPDVMLALTEQSDVLSRLPVRWVDACALSIDQMRAIIAREKRQRGGLDFAVIDYGQLARAASRGRSREEEVSAVWRGAKLAAREDDIAVFALAQMNRDVEKRGKDAEPILADLRESGSIEQDSDAVLFTHVARDGETSRSSLVIRKQRNGPTGTALVHFDRRFSEFRDVDAHAHSGMTNGHATPSYYDAERDDGSPSWS